MTCIVAVRDGGKVYMGGDSAGVSGGHVIQRADPKVFKNGEFIIGIAGSFRGGNVLRYSLTPPPITTGLDRYMNTAFIEAVRGTFIENGNMAKYDNEDYSSVSFLVGIRTKIYVVYDDFHVGIPRDKFDSIGSGSYYALGYLEATKGQGPRQRVRRALVTAAKYCGGVSPPFKIISA